MGIPFKDIINQRLINRHSFFVKSTILPRIFCIMAFFIARYVEVISKILKLATVIASVAKQSDEATKND